MGSNVSTVYDEAQGLPTKNYETPSFQQPSKKGQVIAFHSSAKWKQHFEASKQTSKLVHLYIFMQ